MSLERESNHDLGRSFEERRARYRSESRQRSVGQLQRARAGDRDKAWRQFKALLHKRLLTTARAGSRPVVLIVAALGFAIVEAAAPVEVLREGDAEEMAVLAEVVLPFAARALRPARRVLVFLGVCNHP